MAREVSIIGSSVALFSWPPAFVKGILMAKVAFNPGSLSNWIFTDSPFLSSLSSAGRRFSMEGAVYLASTVIVFSSLFFALSCAVTVMVFSPSSSRMRREYSPSVTFAVWPFTFTQSRLSSETVPLTVTVSLFVLDLSAGLVMDSSGFVLSYITFTGSEASVDPDSVDALAVSVFSLQ